MTIKTRIQITGSGMIHTHRKQIQHRMHGGALREMAMFGSGNLATLKKQFHNMSMHETHKKKKRPKYLSF